MRLLKVCLGNYRGVQSLEFDAGPLTVLFGKNNAGKTTILEAFYGLFEPDDTRAIRARGPIFDPAGGREVALGWAYAELEVGLPFDEEVCAAAALDTMTTSKPRRVVFTNTMSRGGTHVDEIGSSDPNRVRQVTEPNLHALFLDWEFKDLHQRVEDAIADLAAGEVNQTFNRYWPWLDEDMTSSESRAWRVNPTVVRLAQQLGSLATDLLPDFVDGSIECHATDLDHLDLSPSKVDLYCNERHGGWQLHVDVVGHGAARWMAAALQIALHLMEENPGLMALRDLGPKAFSGHLLLVDEPEAHLHPGAVASIVRWCQRMVDHGFTIMTASHHEEFLRAARDEVTLVRVTSDAEGIEAQTLDVPTTSTLLELAEDVGVHPAMMLSLRRAFLFVEGPLDEAVLDEYGGLDLEAAGVMIIPIHGTKNLEGLITGELVTKLGTRYGILTDATDPTTMTARSGRKRSSEERKVIKVVEMAKEKGIPQPTVFGVPEDDLLFALPADAIRAYLKGPFPGWKELRSECREALGKGPSDSVDWKSYALEHYGLPITEPPGVRHIVRTLDLDNVPLPSIRRVIDEVVAWAGSPE